MTSWSVNSLPSGVVNVSFRPSSAISSVSSAICSSPISRACAYLAERPSMLLITQPFTVLRGGMPGISQMALRLLPPARSAQIRSAISRL